jgi:hypothetical protein
LLFYCTPSWAIYLIATLFLNVFVFKE